MITDGSQHTVIIGRNGSGKTVRGVWLLAMTQNMDWYCLNHKQDELLCAVPSLKHMKVGQIPSKNEHGIFEWQPVYQDESDEEFTEELFKDAFKRGNTGIYIDESYMISPKSKGLIRILTQGRSRKCPVIALTQRPVSVPRVFFTETVYTYVYDVQDNRDVKVIAEFTPQSIINHIGQDCVDPLEKFECVFIDQNIRQLDIISPTPSPDEVKRLFKSNIRRKRI